MQEFGTCDPTSTREQRFEMHEMNQALSQKASRSFLRGQPPEEMKENDKAPSNTSMVSHQPYGSLDRTHVTEDVATVWQQQHIHEPPHFDGKSHADTPNPKLSNSFKFAPLPFEAGNPHAIGSQTYRDNSLTKKRPSGSSFAKKPSY